MRYANHSYRIEKRCLLLHVEAQRVVNVSQTAACETNIENSSLTHRTAAPVCVTLRQQKSFTELTSPSAYRQNRRRSDVRQFERRLDIDDEPLASSSVSQPRCFLHVA